MEKNPIIQVKHLKKYYNQGKANEVRAVDDISFDIYEGETFGLVGESGSGKSTTGKLIMKLEPMSDGEIIFLGDRIQDMRSRKDLLGFRKNIQMVFQDPYASLNPQKTVFDIIGGPLGVHKMTKTRAETKEIVSELLSKVGLSKAFLNRYPKEFSGGQCQRVGIARAIALKPKFIIADEAISALDVSIQAQIVNLLRKLKEDESLTYLFIAHDLAMVKYICNRIAVMHLGKILELSTSDQIYHHPLHPYTKSLLSAIPEPDPVSERERTRIKYDNKYETYTAADRNVALHEIVDGHYVYCSEAEIEMYRGMYKEGQQ